MSNEFDFKNKSENIAFDLNHRAKLKYNIGKYDVAVKRGRQQFSNLDLAKNRAASIKFKAINELEKYLIEFEAKFTARGGKVIWAQDSKEALKEILQIIKKYGIRKVVKSKSMVSEELEINDFLLSNGVKAIETDLGEYIVQLAGEKPYHIITPAMHKSKQEVALLFNEKFGVDKNASAEEITAFVRKKLRGDFLDADCGITGANFLIADSGAIVLTENEGNAIRSISNKGIHIVVVGIEKILPSLEDLDLFWPLLATHGSGQELTVYNSIVYGPRQDSEDDGPSEMFVVLLDNGRTNLLSKEEQRIALGCIRCGACLNSCPIYKNIGGYTYGTTYTGPIGAVIEPHLNGMENYSHLNFASSLCGKCSEVCPVKIPLHKLLLANRREAVEAGFMPGTWNTGMKFSKVILKRRGLLDFFSSSQKNFMLRYFASNLWGKRRDLPSIAKKSFYTLWKENHYD
jgi:L-lactate dehydrogenase complex protein LldF